MDLFVQEVQEVHGKGRIVLVLAGTKSRAKSIGTMLLENEIPTIYSEQKDIVDIDNKRVIVTSGNLSNGFEYSDLDLVVITDENSVTREPKKINKPSAFKEGKKVVFADLSVGDYIVHSTHGIGQYIGIHTLIVDNVKKDYIKLKYKDDDTLYIPTNQLDNIRKYIGAGDGSPKLNRLGSKDFLRTKAKVKDSLRNIAKGLIELYAKRKQLMGYKYSEDTVWQAQFEEQFPYQETEDQIRCIEEVKKDMERETPMDRLLCGDVGYGKTEVAIRAAFKAVMEGKQVAYLVPTTVLAEQQFHNFRDRMKEFPVRVDVLNRFRTRKEQAEILKKLKSGELDIIIGTHRILQKDIGFRDLGLLIIDEEHRFGVEHKEIIKELKNNIDVLTMTATPIPRTLHMSIVGIRDMSVIYEPPKNRRPVQTYVLEYDEEVIREAIIKELERHGQVFYLFNRVETIERKASEISRLVPEARVAFAHGKMTGTELEGIMKEFIDGNIDVMICTTIIESGIDISNANTIIIEDADRLGLAQLYQVRGRVGRSDRLAYAYITYRRDKVLTEVSEKRLKAIKEFTEFGSGFKVALRDLEIRGAGNILGPEQHGHMEAVGYEMYCKLLEEAVREISGEEVKQEFDTQIDLKITAYIPITYIENVNQKIEVYQDIANIETEEQIVDIIDGLIDRYGEVPNEVNNLFEVSRIKVLSRKLNIISISQKDGKIIFQFKDPESFDSSFVQLLIDNYKSRVYFSAGSNPYITYKLQSLKESDILKEIYNLLKMIQ
jgi:transcription-repair coupling factor (superfamily II helicase)